MNKPKSKNFALVYAKQKIVLEYKKIISIFKKTLVPIPVNSHRKFNSSTRIKITVLGAVLLLTALAPNLQRHGFLVSLDSSAVAKDGALSYVNGYPKLNGNFVDCNGNIDNDLGHHSTNQNDNDPGHRVGMNCPAGSFVAGLAAIPAPSTPNVKYGNLNVWWPKDGYTLSGSQPFKAQLAEAGVADYVMYWQVDGGALSLMNSNYQDYPHKESLVDLSGWNWKSSESYVITFVAKDQNGAEVGRASVNVNISHQNVKGSNGVIRAVASNAVKTVQAPSNSIFSGAKFYVNPYNNSKKQADAWKDSRPSDSAQMQKIASGNESQWFGNWNYNVEQDVNNTVNSVNAAGSLPVMVAYNIPARDCGGYSSGGINSADGYRQWIRDFAKGVGNRKAAIILEPDALAQVGCLSQNDLQTRYGLIKFAVEVFKNNGQAVYIDAGHPGWISAQDMASRLNQAGVGQADGFALNIANFVSTQDNIAYGQAISALTSGKHFIIDTGRNGNGPTWDAQWCNPSGRALGQKATTNTGNNLVDALLWVKDPGGSDGYCNGGPNAGAFWAEYALGLAQRSAW